MNKNTYNSIPLLTLALTGFLLSACSGGGADTSAESKPRPSDPANAAKYDVDKTYEHYTALAESIEKALLDDNIDEDEVETIAGHYRDMQTATARNFANDKKSEVYRKVSARYDRNHTMSGVISWKQDIEIPLKQNNVFRLAITKTELDMIEEDPEKFGFLKEDL